MKKLLAIVILFALCLPPMTTMASQSEASLAASS